jgi:hypothetical protein
MDAMDRAIKAAGFRVAGATRLGRWDDVWIHSADVLVLEFMAEQGHRDPTHPAVVAARRETATRIAGS